MSVPFDTVAEEDDAEPSEEAATPGAGGLSPASGAAAFPRKRNSMPLSKAIKAEAPEPVLADNMFMSVPQEADQGVDPGGELAVASSMRA